MVATDAPKLDASREGETTSLMPGEHGQMIFRKMSIAGLANTMANILHTPVVDRSGVDGFYDFTLDPNRFAAQAGDETPFRRAGFGERVIAAVSRAARSQAGKAKGSPRDHRHRPRGETGRQFAPGRRPPSRRLPPDTPLRYHREIPKSEGMHPLALTISGLSKTYSNGVKALQNISLTIGNNMFGLLGPNGAGKSTLMRTVATLQDPDSGSDHLDGLDVVAQKVKSARSSAICHRNSAYTQDLRARSCCIISR